MDKLTKAEEEIMQLFWEHGPSTVSQLIEQMPDPKPPHSTISTFVRILEKKEFVDHKAYGRTYEYFPLVDKEDYTKFSLKKLVGSYFDGSMNSLVSFLVKEEDLSLKDLSNIINDLENEDQ
jgi:predicted transcriptional regulator